MRPIRFPQLVRIDTGDTVLHIGDALYVRAVDGGDLAVTYHGRPVAVLPERVVLDDPRTWFAWVTGLFGDVTEISLNPYPVELCGCCYNGGGFAVRPCTTHRMLDEAPERCEHYSLKPDCGLCNLDALDKAEQDNYEYEISNR